MGAEYLQQLNYFPYFAFVSFVYFGSSLVSVFVMFQFAYNFMLACMCLHLTRQTTILAILLSRDLDSYGVMHGGRHTHTHTHALLLGGVSLHAHGGGGRGGRGGNTEPLT